MKLGSLPWQFSIKDLQVIYTEMSDKRQHSMMKSAKREKEKHAEQGNLVYMHHACIREIVKNERDTIKRRHRAISWASLFELSQFLLWAFVWFLRLPNSLLWPLAQSIILCSEQCPHHHHHSQAVLVDCRTKVSPSDRQFILSCASWFHFIPVKFSISPFHLILCFPQLCFQPLGNHSVACTVHRLSVQRILLQSLINGTIGI